MRGGGGMSRDQAGLVDGDQAPLLILMGLGGGSLTSHHQRLLSPRLGQPCDSLQTSGCPRFLQYQSWHLECMARLPRALPLC